MITVRLPPDHPGRSINNEMRARGLTQSELARGMGVHRCGISMLIQGRMSVSPRIALRLAAFFGGEAELWMRMQSNCDLAIAREKHGERGDVG